MVAGSVAGAAGTILGAKAEAKGLRREAAQLEVNAGQERAVSQRQAMEERRQGRLASSRALAVAAASGGGVDDPTIVNAMANLDGDAEYRARVALFEGNTRGDDLERQAKDRRREAKSVKTQSYFKAAGSLLGAGSTMYDRYGGKGS
jgi:hypothetical protein